MRVTADDTSVDIDEIVNFARKISVIYDYPQKMRKYAQSNLKWIILQLYKKQS